jgi:hypothetical protein
VASSIVTESSEAMVIGYASDLPKLQRAIEVLLVKDASHTTYRTVLEGKPIPWGFGRNRYFAATFKSA